MYVCCSSHWF